MKALIKILLGALAVFAASYVLPGVHVKDFWTALVVAIVLALVNAVLRPILILLTLPATILTFGLFLFVINSCLVLLVAKVVPGFTVDGFWWAMVFSIAASIIGSFLDTVAEG